MTCIVFLFLEPVQHFGGNGWQKKLLNGVTTALYRQTPKIDIMKLIKSFAYALNGLKICFVTEPNFRIHTFLAIVAVIFGIAFHISAIEWITIGFCIAFVIAMEMLNTAIEKLCNVVHQELHPGIKKVKDIAAGAVLVSAIFSLITGLIIFLPKVIMYLKSVQN